MTTELHAQYIRKFTWIWRVFFTISVIVAGISLKMLISTPSKTAAGLAGYSASKIVIIFSFILIILLSFWLLIQSWRRNYWIEGVSFRIYNLLLNPNIWCVVALLSGLIFLLGIYLISLIPEIVEPFTKVIFERLLPVIIWITCMAGLVLILLFVMRIKSGSREWFKKNQVFFISLILISLIFLIWGIIVKTSYKVESQVTGWNSLGSPILEPQVFIAWIGGMAMLAVIVLIDNRSMRQKESRYKKYHLIDYIFMLLIWITSIILWNSKPIYPNWFVTNPREPNFEYYPASDAFGYDMSAQVFMIGEGWKSWEAPFLRRPLHTLFLTSLHLVAGQEYERIVFFQIVILALIPVLMYLLTAMIHNRISGVIASILITFREANSIAISGTATTSHAKLLMSDLPATFAVLLFLILTIAWFQRKDRISVYPLIAGGFLAIPVLMRFETILFLFFIPVIAAIFFNIKKNPSLWLKNMLLFTLGFFLLLSPWVIRNWRYTGALFIDEPSFRLAVIYARYRPAFTETPVPTSTPEIDPATNGSVLYPPETTPSASPARLSTGYSYQAGFQLTDPINTELQPTPTLQPLQFSDTVREQAKTYILLHTGQFIRFIITHYWNSQIQSFIILPTTFRPIESLVGFMGHKTPARFLEECCSSIDFVRRMPYWKKWDGYFLRQSFVPIVLMILLIAMGTNEAWKKSRVIGLMPLLTFLVYLAGNALFRNSGGRYILPVDWVSILYFSIGLSTFSLTCYRHILRKENLPAGIEFYRPQLLQEATASKLNILRTPGFYIAAVGLLLLGSIMPVMELASQPRYNPTFQEIMYDKVFNSNFLYQNQKTILRSFIEQGAGVTVGRALYPTFLFGNEVEPGSQEQFRIQSFPRINFLLAKSESELIVMPLEKKPSDFPNGSDVLVIACPGSFESVLSVIIFDQSGNPKDLLIRSPLPENITCPLEFPAS